MSPDVKTPRSPASQVLTDTKMSCLYKLLVMSACLFWFDANMLPNSSDIMGTAPKDLSTQKECYVITCSLLLQAKNSTWRNTNMTDVWSVKAPWRLQAKWCSIFPSENLPKPSRCLKNEPRKMLGDSQCDWWLLAGPSVWDCSFLFLVRKHTWG